MTTLDADTILASIAEQPLTVLVFFRGGWCPFCQGYLRELNASFRERVESSGGRLIGVTSQSAAAASAAHADWGLSYDVASQPSNALARRFGVSITPKAQTPLADHPDEYPQGMAQPAVIALDSRGDVVYRWAIVPAEMNLGGATDRPLPDEVWAGIDAGLQGRPAPESGDQRLDVAFLADHYPDQHAAFQAWVASMQAG